jgi:ATP-dependent RNA helicase DDX24/MAK5
VPNVRYLVIDEADRMVEKGHFQELTNILNLINTHENKQRQRQTFVFSATLTFVPTKPQRLEFAKKKKKKNVHQITAEEKLESLMYQVGVSEKAKIIDVGSKQRTTQTLTEARISCTMEDKDIYLFYILRQYPGRTLVFANSKDCVRRLISIFTLLHCTPLALHADMQQRQRLKNLERFKANACSVLIATDVAARGLDIPNVQHVIHYQVPRTTESYVHRSGRTARATKEGLSVMLVSPDDLHNYRKIIKALNRDDDLPVFPVDIHCLANVKSCVVLARLIDRDEHRSNKAKAHKRWIQQVASELDIELDDEQLSDDGQESQQNAAQLRKLHVQKRQLEAMLKQPVLGQTYYGKYPTKSGKLITPFTDGSLQNVTAIQQIKQQQSKVKR